MNLDRRQHSAIALALVPVMLVWLLNGFYMAALSKRSVSLFWLVDFGQWIVLPGVALLGLARKAAVFPAHYGLSRTGLCWKTALLGSFMVFASAGLAFTLARNISWHLLGHPKGIFSLSQVFPEGLMGHLTLLYAAISAGIVESIFFISLPWLLHRQLRAAASPLIFTTLISLVFAIAHWEQGQHAIVGAFAAQVVFCFWYFKLGNLWPVAGGHALIDLVLFS